MQASNLRSRHASQTLPDGFNSLVHRTFGNAQITSNLLACEPFGYQRKDLTLLVGQGIKNGQVGAKRRHCAGMIVRDETGNKYIR